MKIEFLLERFNNFLTPKRMRYSWIVGGCLWLGWVFSIIAGKGNTDLFGTLIGTDFSAFYTAAKIMLAGNSPNLYDLNTAYLFQQELHNAQTQGLTLFLNPPHFTLLMAPFGLLPYLPSVIMWIILGIFCLWYSIKLLNPGNNLRIFLLTLTWLPVFSAVSFGQNTFLTLLFFCLTYHFWIRKNYLISGLIFSLLLYKPQFLLFVGFLWLLSTRKYIRALIGLGIGISTQIGINILLFPEASINYIHYMKNVAPILTSMPGFPVWNTFSVQAFWEMLLPQLPTLGRFLYLFCIILGFILYLSVWRKYSHDQPIIFAWTLIWMVWSMPYISMYDWTILVIPAILLWKYLSNYSICLKPLYAFLWILSFISNSLTFIQLEYWESALQISIPALLITIIGLQKILIKRKKELEKTN